MQLINASTNEQLWSETYDRKLTDIFAVETEIAKAVADKLRARLTGTETRAIAARPTENAAAHQLYLKGRYFWNKTTANDLRKSIDYFTQAIAADPNYALAHVGVADANLLLPFIAGGRPQDCYPQAKAAAQKALEIDETWAKRISPLPKRCGFMISITRGRAPNSSEDCSSIPTMPPGTGDGAGSWRH